MTLEELAVTVGQHTTDLKNVKLWQEKQNGSLQKLEAKIDAINTRVNQVLGGVVVACILLVINVVLRR